MLKDNNSDNLNLTTSWVGGATPSSADVAVWDATVTSANTVNLGASTNWYGVRIANSGGPVTILTNAPQTLTVGLGGIDLSGATQDLSLSNAITIAPGGLQRWNVASGRTLRTLALPTKPTQPAGNSSGGLQFSTTGIITLGRAAVPLLIDPGNNPYATYGTSDWAALDSSGNAIAATYTDASTALTAGANNNIVGDFNINATADVASMRFNDPTPHTINISTSGTSRTLTARGILMTPNCGGATIAGTATSSFIRPNRVSTAGASFDIYQNSTIGDLTINATWGDASSSTPVQLVKFGPGNLNIGGGVGNSFRGGVVINGGTLTLASGTRLGSGTITVNSGRLVLVSPAALSNPTAVFNGGTTNSLRITAANSQILIATNLTFNPGAQRLQFSYNNAVPMSTTAAPLLTSNLTVNGSITIDIFNGSMAVGAYPLIQFTNSAPNFAAFALGFLPPRVSAQLSNDTANASIDLVVTAVDEPIRWAAGNGTWDTTTANWVNPFGASTTYQQLSGYGDSVLFEDSQSIGSPIVTLNAALAPAAVTVNSSKNFTLTGSGSITGLGGIAKQGTGVLTLGTLNSFTGGLIVNGGIVNFSVQENLGASNSPITFGGGTLQFASGNTADISTRTVTLATGGGSIDTAANAVAFASPIGNNGAGGLTKLGAGTLTLNGTNQYSGNTLVSQGTLVLGSSTYISNSAAILVNSGATLDASLSGLALSTPGSQVLSGAGLVNGAVTVPVSTTITPAGNGATGTLTVNGDLQLTGGTLAYDVSTAARDLIVVNNLTLTSGTVQVAAAGNLTNGTYKVLQYSGALSGLAANIQVLGFAQLNKVATLSDATPGEIDLVVATGRGIDLVWQGDGAANLWDTEGAYNWTNSAGASAQFLNLDKVIFNDTSPNTTVNLVGVLQPGSVTVNSANNYTFQDSGTGSGKINGTASLTKSGPGTLTLLTPNINTGPTLINAGTVQVGNGGVTGDIGTGNITNNGALVFMQTDDRSVPGQISGNGSLTQQGSGTLTLVQNNTYTGPTTINSGGLQLGTGGATGTLGSGAVTNSGTLIYNHSGTFTVGNIKTGPSGGGTLVFAGPANVTLAGGNTYQNNTYITNGVVTLSAPQAIPSSLTDPSSTGWLVLDGGAAAGLLDVHGFDQTVNALSGLGGTAIGVITNSGASGTNVLTVLGTAGTTFNGRIVDNPTGAKEMLIVRGATTLRLNGNNTYTGGTFVGDTATLGFGLGASIGNGGGIVMSNGTTFRMYNGSGGASSFPPNNLTLLPDAAVTLSSSQQGNGYAGQIYGDATSTNIIANDVSFSVNNVKQYQNFPGTVQIASGASLRFSSTSLSVNGGDNTTFELEGTLNTRNGTGSGAGVSLGALFGTAAGSLAGAGNADGNGVYVIGAKNVDCTFSGTISGTTPRGTSITKVGTGRLTLDGTLTYDRNTTVSNGVLAIGSISNPSTTLDNSPTISIQGTNAVLDVSALSDGTLHLGNLTNQVLNGFGTIRGSLNEGANSIVNVAVGTLTVNNTATLGGIVNMWLNRTNAATCSELVAGSFVIGASAALNVTNVGPNLVNGGTFRLFSAPVSFPTVYLPAFDSTGSNAYTWNNRLAIDGTIQLASGGLPPVNTTPASISVAVSGGTLTFTWPADRTGWRLLAQTNNLASGVSANPLDWGTIAGSTATNQVSVTVNPAQPAGFYKLVYP